MYHIDYIDEKIVNYFNDKLDHYIKDNYKIESKTIATLNGFQTPNIVKNIEVFVKKQLLKNMFQPTDISHMHLIHYYKRGRQKAHAHPDKEKCSFILYLNNSDGDTVFMFKDRVIMEKPTKGKIIFFTPQIPHKAKISYKNKRILVGAIDKEWRRKN